APRGVPRAQASPPRRDRQSGKSGPAHLYLTPGRSSQVQAAVTGMPGTGAVTKVEQFVHMALELEVVEGDIAALAVDAIANAANDRLWMGAGVAGGIKGAGGGGGGG